MEFNSENLHHAYFLHGEEEEAEKFLGSLFQKLNIIPAGNPDICISKALVFGIDEARTIKSKADKKAFGEKKVFVIYSSQITIEAQNALLKVFEEPTPDTHFFIVSSKEILLKTLLSRVATVRLQNNPKNRETAEKFLKSSVRERLGMIKDELNNENFSLSDFLENILAELNKDHKKLSLSKQVFKVSKYSLDPAANSRLILEHLALSLPESIE